MASKRKPPEPSRSHAEVAEWLGSVMPGLQQIVTQLDALIRKTLPDLEYAVKWKTAWYGVPGRGWVIQIAAYDVSANLVFPGGAAFDPKPPLGDDARYVKIRSLADAKAPEVRDWVRQAGAGSGDTGRARLRAPFSKQGPGDRRCAIHAARALAHSPRCPWAHCCFTPLVGSTPKDSRSPCCSRA